jgi:hypothetical protein
MLASRFVRTILLASILTARSVAAADAPVPMAYEQLDLTDGRKLKKVTVKSYDAQAEKFVVIADGKLMSVPLALVPEPLGSKLKAAAPAAGASTSSTPVRKVHVPVVVSGPDNIPKIYRPTANTPEEETKVHKSIALRQVALHYTYQYPLAPGTSKVTPGNFQLEEPRPVKGWIGRYSTRGSVTLEFFDSSGLKSGSIISRFEVVTEKDGGPSARIIDFSVKP